MSVVEEKQTTVPVGPDYQPGWRPIPDPTALTTEQLNRAIIAERDYVGGQIDVLRERLTGIDRATELRLQGIIDIPGQIAGATNNLASLVGEQFSALHAELTERNIRFIAQIDSTRSLVEEKIESAGATSTERFHSIANQFAERDTRSERESRDNKVAVDAAFAAQKEAAAKQDEANQKAIDKSEKATGETITKLGELFQTTTKGLEDKIDDMKLRIGVLESNVNGIVQRIGGGNDRGNTNRDESAAVRQTISIAISLLVVFVTIAIAVAAYASKK